VSVNAIDFEGLRANFGHEKAADSLSFESAKEVGGYAWKRLSAS
jgi:hypothetical protein